MSPHLRNTGSRARKPRCQRLKDVNMNLTSRSIFMASPNDMRIGVTESNSTSLKGVRLVGVTLPSRGGRQAPRSRRETPFLSPAVPDQRGLLLRRNDGLPAEEAHRLGPSDLLIEVLKCWLTLNRTHPTPLCVMPPWPTRRLAILSSL